ncbi:hypothetical protein, variant [Sphaeroforma arctica JP610]|nr:hypothetical protein, variant [Sphaeroforma arctica JP610]KNC78177.1 hypothetical protein, variant [Sphaeroforma arctica JP610]|eukprot:XP_014152079.1 hypothetical protein, variant [Sphaeroforma arctica JP610]
MRGPRAVRIRREMDENRVLFALLNKCLTDAGLEVGGNDGVGEEQPNTHLSIVLAQVRQREYAPYATETSTCVINKSRDDMDGEVGRNNSAIKLQPASHEMKLEWNSRWEQSKGVLGAKYKRLIDGRECTVRVRCIAVGRHLAIHCEGSLPLDEETSASCASEPQTSDVAERVSIVHSTRIMATKYVKRIEVDENGTRITGRCADLPGLWLDIRNSIVFRLLSFFKQHVQGIDRCSLAGLMPELQLRIFSMVPARDMCALSQTCRAFRVLATHDDLWRRLLKIHFSAHVPIEM